MTHAELMATPQMRTALALKNAALDGMDKQAKRIVDLENVLEQVARSSCFDQRIGGICICFTCQARRILGSGA